MFDYEFIISFPNTSPKQAHINTGLLFTDIKKRIEQLKPAGHLFQLGTLDFSRKIIIRFTPVDDNLKTYLVQQLSDIITKSDLVTHTQLRLLK